MHFLNESEGVHFQNESRGVPNESKGVHFQNESGGVPNESEGVHFQNESEGDPVLRRIRGRPRSKTDPRETPFPDESEGDPKRIRQSTFIALLDSSSNSRQCATPVGAVGAF